MQQVSGNMSPAPDCSVVLCTFNGEAFLSAQLDSLLAQTQLPAEIIVADDGSTDRTLAVLQAALPRFEARGIRVDLRVNPDNLGYIGNFEQAFARATGELIFPCDQDDVWHPEKLERMAATFAADPALDVLHSDARLVDAAGQPLGKHLLAVLELTPRERARMRSGDAFEVLLKRNIVTGAAMAFRRRVLASARPFPAEWSHDEWLAICASLQGTVRLMDDALIDYRQHGNNQIGVRVRGLVHKATGIAGYRRAFLARMENRIDVLAERAESLHGLPMTRIDALGERLAHARNRRRADAGLATRLPIIATELLAGRYHRFGKGLRSALVDLMRVN